MQVPTCRPLRPEEVTYWYKTAAHTLQEYDLYEEPDPKAGIITQICVSKNQLMKA